MTTPEKSAPAEVKLTKAQLWAKEGKCVKCGKPIVKSIDGEGSTCFAHEGKLRRNADSAATPPEGWLRMSKVCRAAEAVGLTAGQVVRASGGDACTDALLDPLFRVTYVGNGKWMDPRVLTLGFDMIRKAAAQPKAEKPKAPTAVPTKAPVSSTADALKAATAGKHPVKK